MEAMTRKTQQLEKENKTLKLKRQALSGNVCTIVMEKERYEAEKEGYEAEIQQLKSRETKLKGIIKQMQDQGRGVSQDVVSAAKNGYAPAPGDEEAQFAEESAGSEYEEEYEEEEEGREEDDDEETEDDEVDPVEVWNGPKSTSPPSAAMITNGHG
jgi:cell division protein FtsB